MKKLKLGTNFEDFVLHHTADLECKLLPLIPEHIYVVEALPLHHRDPFDRLLLAQAKVEKLPIISADPQFNAYDVEVIW